MYLIICIFFLLCITPSFCNPAAAQRSKTCTVKAGGSETVDDAPAIYDAFNECGHDGRIVFENTTYYINSVMNTSALQNCDIDIYGTLLVLEAALISIRCFIIL